MSEQIPSIGRVVHYVLEGGRNQGDHRPALIVRVWGDTPDAKVNLVVFTDGANDQYGPSEPPGNYAVGIWATSVVRDEGHALGTYHWPEYVPPVKS